jgi:hypothetical protein
MSLEGPFRPTHDVAALPSVNQPAHRQTNGILSEALLDVVEVVEWSKQEMFTWLLEVIQTGMPCLKSDKSCEQHITLAESGAAVAWCGGDVPAGYSQRLPAASRASQQSLLTSQHCTHLGQEVCAANRWARQQTQHDRSSAQCRWSRMTIRIRFPSSRLGFIHPIGRPHEQTWGKRQARRGWENLIKCASREERRETKLLTRQPPIGEIYLNKLLKGMECDGFILYGTC